MKRRALLALLAAIAGGAQVAEAQAQQGMVMPVDPPRTFVPPIRITLADLGEGWMDPEVITGIEVSYRGRLMYLPAEEIWNALMEGNNWPGELPPVER